MRLKINLSTSKAVKTKTPRQLFLSALMTIMGSEATELAELYQSDADSDHEELRNRFSAIADKMLESK